MVSGVVWFRVMPAYLRHFLRSAASSPPGEATCIFPNCLQKCQAKVSYKTVELEMKNSHTLWGRFYFVSRPNSFCHCQLQELVAKLHGLQMMSMRQWCTAGSKADDPCTLSFMVQHNTVCADLRQRLRLNATHISILCWKSTSAKRKCVLTRSCSRTICLLLETYNKSSAEMLHFQKNPCCVPTTQIDLSAQSIKTQSSDALFFLWSALWGRGKRRKKRNKKSKKKRTRSNMQANGSNLLQVGACLNVPLVSTTNSARNEIRVFDLESMKWCFSTPSWTLCCFRPLNGFFKLRMDFASQKVVQSLCRRS